MSTFLLQVFSFSLIWIILILVSVGPEHEAFKGLIGIGLFGIIGGCGINAIFKFFGTTERRKHNIIAFVLCMIVFPPFTYVCYRSYLSLNNDPRTQACGEVVDTAIKLAIPNTKDHDRYYMHVRFPEDYFSRRLEVNAGQFYRYAVVSHQVCVIYIREEDMSFGHYNQLLAITSN